MEKVNAFEDSRRGVCLPKFEFERLYSKPTNVPPPGFHLKDTNNNLTKHHTEK